MRPTSALAVLRRSGTTLERREGTDVRFVWLLSAGGGAVPPQLALCEALVDAGHDVVAVVGTRVAAQAEQSVDG